MIKGAVSIVIISILLGSILVMPVSSDDTIGRLSGNTLYVGGSGPGNYTMIQNAIDNASDGDTVYVFNGTYYEDVEINIGNISLIGEDKNMTVIDAQGAGRVISVYSSKVTISGFKLTNSSLTSNGGIWGAIVLIYGHNCIISQNIICSNKNNAIVCSCEGGCSNNIEGNVIFDNDRGIVLQMGSNNIINNIIRNNSCGIKLDASENTISNNIIMDNEYGIKFTPLTGHNIISNNHFMNNQYGIDSSLPNDPKNNIIRYDDFICHNNFINNTKNEYHFLSFNFYNNYWDDWIGLENKLLITLNTLLDSLNIPFGIPSYRIQGVPNERIPYSFARNLDWNPALEPYNIGG